MAFTNIGKCADKTLTEIQVGKGFLRALYHSFLPRKSPDPGAKMIRCPYPEFL